MRTPTPSPTPSPAASQDQAGADDWFTHEDAFGLFRCFTRLPKHDPEAGFTLESVANAPNHEKPVEQEGPRYESIAWLTQRTPANRNDDDARKLGPFGDNVSQFRLVDWFYGRGSSVLSNQRFDDLLAVITSKGFTVADIEGFSAKKADRLLEQWLNTKDLFVPQHGWYETSVSMPVPKTRVSYASEAVAAQITIHGVIHRRLVDLITGVISDPHSRFVKDYHWIPSKIPGSPEPSCSPSPPSGPPQPLRVLTDCYNSDAMLDEDEKIRKMPHVKGEEDVEYAILPLLLWSDETCLSQFGNAKLWPIYMYFGNISKYVRGRPSEFAAHHVAYIPSLPDDIKDAYEKVYGAMPTADTLKFCKRELFCRIWLMLLDEDFMTAYRDGILLKCGDGVVRRLFPRFFTYSADYPEKILIAALKPLALCMCPRCYTRMDEIAHAGSEEDDRRRAAKRQDTPANQALIKKARRALFKGYSPAGKLIKGLLHEKSLNPIQSAFSIRLAQYGFDVYDMLVPDLMHEFDLGVWKGIFIHLMRLLHAQGDLVVKEFDRRMRAMPTWGRDKVRRFWQDASARKKLAARDYEAYLIVMLPAIDGLLPLQDGETVADMLFELANWHALAKLRMHHDVTLENMKHATKHMYDAVKTFAATTCQRHNVVELPSESEARVRRQKKKNPDASSDAGRRTVQFNVINTVKFHSLGDHTEYIQRSGPTDNSTTEIGEVEHKHVKHEHDRTNKVDYEIQIAENIRNTSALADLRPQDPDFVAPSLRKDLDRRAALALAEAHERSGTKPLPRTAAGQKRVVPMSPSDHYRISQSQRNPISLREWTAQNAHDPATKGFIPHLYEHVAVRLLGGDTFTEPEDFSPEQLDGVQILDDKMYPHKMLRLNHTSYDLRREQDPISPLNQADVMVLAPEWDKSAGPFWFARVIGILHVNARYVGPNSTRANRKWQRVEFLWVRWFTRDTTRPSGFQHRRQQRVHFVDANEPDNVPFSFVDPDDIIRAAYLLPCHSQGLTEELLGPSRLARKLPIADEVDENRDYAYFEVSMFADRDIFMRHHGGGIGHKGVGIDSDAVNDDDDDSSEELTEGSVASGEPEPDETVPAGDAIEDEEDEDVEMMVAQDAEGVDEDADEELFEQHDPDEEDSDSDSEAEVELAEVEGEQRRVRFANRDNDPWDEEDSDFEDYVDRMYDRGRYAGF
ncbi:hypothetical protein C8T65DRAFT_578127 [Cerioporus squamosus]|nr:hypothetical protein C8T65DRAFT_578127 [Cerioporus squamosus]